MYTGDPNPNISSRLEKMVIFNMAKQEKFEVLYNPQSYQQTRSVEYSQIPMIGTDIPMAQFNHGSGETLKVQLFFDSLSAASEVGGGQSIRNEFDQNSRLASAKKTIDVRTYTQKIYNLMLIVKDIHVPPELELRWSSLQFKGYLISCTQNFVRFNEAGTPVRATLDCEFQEHIDPGLVASMSPLESPDTTKYRVVRQGDSLWALAAKEYGEAREWRAIAGANGLANPRSIRSGDTLVLPALD